MRDGDEDLVGGSSSDSPAAFVDLFWRHGTSVHGYLARRTSRQEADDLLGEVWVRAFKARGSYDPRWPDARPWLYGIARHVLLAHWRRADRAPAGGADAPAFDPWDEVDRRLDASAERRKLQQVMVRLSPVEREVLLLVTWEHLTPSEAAVTLGIAPGTARSRLHRALSVFRREFDADPFFALRVSPKEVC
jgi:RNA polymerase sigma-70 factor (ECF subfamily)